MTELKYTYDNLGKRENEVEGEKETGTESIVLYKVQENARNICFVLSDERQFFLNYAYLISGEYIREQNTITLTFSTHKVTLKGNKLQELFDQLMASLPKKIICVDKRYVQTIDESKILIYEINIATA